MAATASTSTGPKSSTTDPALTYTLEQFVSMQVTDTITFRNFSIFESINDIEVLDHNILENYIEDLESICVPITLTLDQQKEYRYAPDLLAYDIYGSTQLDFVIMFANGIIDPKEFDFKLMKLPYASNLKDFLTTIYKKESSYINYNRSEYNLDNPVI